MTARHMEKNRPGLDSPEYSRSSIQRMFHMRINLKVAVICLVSAACGQSASEELGGEATGADSEITPLDVFEERDRTSGDITIPGLRLDAETPHYYIDAPPGISGKCEGYFQGHLVDVRCQLLVNMLPGKNPWQQVAYDSDQRNPRAKAYPDTKPIRNAYYMIRASARVRANNGQWTGWQVKDSPGVYRCINECM